MTWDVEARNWLAQLVGDTLRNSTWRTLNVKFGAPNPPGFDGMSLSFDPPTTDSGITARALILLIPDEGDLYRSLTLHDLSDADDVSRRTQVWESRMLPADPSVAAGITLGGLEAVLKTEPAHSPDSDDEPDQGVADEGTPDGDSDDEE